MKLAARSTSYSALADKGRPRLAWLAAVGAILLGYSCDAVGQSSTAIRQRAIAQWSPPREIDKARLARQGFRVRDGKHVTLVTDLPVGEGVDDLPMVVDAAVPLLAQRFYLPAQGVRDWHVLAMVVGDRDKFAAAGLMPHLHDDFPDGLSMGYEVWVADQPSDYYRRHLLLHELVHSFMATQLGGSGPGWYMEGIAELLGTHHWDRRTKKLSLGVMPVSRDSTPMWGRTKLVREAVADNRMLPIAAVVQIDNRQALGVESYAWVWALHKFLDAHPRYRDRYRQLQQHTLDPHFNARFRRAFADDWSDLDTEWRLFTATLTYGHDIEREAIDWPMAAAEPVFAQSPSTPARVRVAANRGWQATRLRLKAGERYELKAGGRFVIGAEPDGTPWVCEAGGVTLEYHAGNPLGTLLAVVDDRPDATGDEGNLPPGTSAFLQPRTIGRMAMFAPERSGSLYLRLNDSPASLADNRGETVVTIRRLP